MASFEETLKVHDELSKGGEWLGAARRWLQSNVKGGDTLCWSSGETVHIPFCKLEEYALKVAVAAVAEERSKHVKS
jgi:hypothetical protein